MEERPASDAIPYQFSDLRIVTDTPLHEVPSATLAEWVSRVVAVESPVHKDEVIRRVREAAGKQRAGARIRPALEVAIRRLADAKAIKLRGDFLWKRGQLADWQRADRPPVRTRAAFPPQYKTLELVAPEELQAAILQVVRDAFRAAESEVSTEALRRLGFHRISSSMQHESAVQVRNLVSSGILSSAPDGSLSVIS